MSNSNKATHALDSAALDQFSQWSLPTSALLLILAAAMVVLSFRPDMVSPRYSTFVVPGLLAGLTCAVALHLLTLAHARDEHRKTDTAFDTNDREFASVFRNTLDGILILDDRGVCVEANPASFAILGTTAEQLIGQPLSKFYIDAPAFEREWSALRSEGGRRGQTNLVRGDGATVFVDYTCTANCVPGRHLLVLCDTTRRNQAENSLRRSEERFHQMADTVQEVFWVMDAQTKEVEYVTRAYESITGRSIASLYEEPSSYRDYIFSDDRNRVLSKLEEAVSTGTFDEEFRIVRPDGDLRWVSVKALPFRDSGQVTRWLFGTAQDITARKRAQKEIDAQVVAADAARAETDALRRSTFVLTQNFKMDMVLDTLLECLADLVPYSTASILLLENLDHLFVAREAPKESARRAVVTLAAEDEPLLLPILVEHKSVFLQDTREETQWRGHRPFAGIRCWLGIPLLASGHALGVLSVGSSDPGKFTPDHFRLAKSLAIPTAAAVQNARLCELTEIYAAELRIRLNDRIETQDTLKKSDSRTAGT
jgi:PAS domain S-box-containing protein